VRELPEVTGPIVVFHAAYPIERTKRVPKNTKAE